MYYELLREKMFEKNTQFYKSLPSNWITSFTFSMEWLPPFRNWSCCLTLRNVNFFYTKEGTWKILQTAHCIILIDAMHKFHKNSISLYLFNLYYRQLWIVSVSWKSGLLDYFEETGVLLEKNDPEDIICHVKLIYYEPTWKSFQNMYLSINII